VTSVGDGKLDGISSLTADCVCGGGGVDDGFDGACGGATIAAGGISSASCSVALATCSFAFSDSGLDPMPHTRDWLATTISKKGVRNGAFRRIQRTTIICTRAIVPVIAISILVHICKSG